MTEHEIVLGARGPYVELRPRDEGDVRVLAVYSARRHVPAGVDPMDAQAMPFAEVLRVLEGGAVVELNPGGALARRLGADELELLRRVLAGD